MRVHAKCVSVHWTAFSRVELPNFVGLHQNLNHFLGGYSAPVMCGSHSRILFLRRLQFSPNFSLGLFQKGATSVFDTEVWWNKSAGGWPGNFSVSLWKRLGLVMWKQQDLRNDVLPDFRRLQISCSHTGRNSLRHTVFSRGFQPFFLSSDPTNVFPIRRSWTPGRRRRQLRVFIKLLTYLLTYLVSFTCHVEQYDKPHALWQLNKQKIVYQRRDVNREFSCCVLTVW